MNVQLSGDYLPEQPDIDLWLKWQKVLTKEQARIYEALCELITDGIDELDMARLAAICGVSKNRLFTVIIPALEALGLVDAAEID